MSNAEPEFLAIPPYVGPPILQPGPGEVARWPTAVDSLQIAPPGYLVRINGREWAQQARAKAGDVVSIMRVEVAPLEVVRRTLGNDPRNDERSLRLVELDSRAPDGCLAFDIRHVNVVTMAQLNQLARLFETEDVSVEVTPDGWEELAEQPPPRLLVRNARLGAAGSSS